MESPEWTLPDTETVLPVLADSLFFFHQRGFPRVPSQVYRASAWLQGVPASPRGAPVDSHGPGARAAGQPRRAGPPGGSPREEVLADPRESPTAQNERRAAQERLGFSLQEPQAKRPAGDGWRGQAPSLLLSELGLVLDSVTRAGHNLPQGLRNILQGSWPQLSAATMAPATGGGGGDGVDGCGGGGTPEPAKPDGRAEKPAPRNREAKVAVAAVVAAAVVESKQQQQGVALVPARGDRARAKKPEVSNPSPCSDGGAPSRSSHPGLPAAVISFTLTSRSLAIRGLLDEGFRDCDAPAWRQHCFWAARRLQAALNASKAESRARLRAGASHPLVLRRYGEAAGGAAGSTSTGNPGHLLADPRVGPRTDGHAALCAAIRRAEELFLATDAAAAEAGRAQTLHCRLPDGSAAVYYPSGRLAVSQVPARGGGAGFYTSAMADGEERALLAAFAPDGRGFVFHARSPRRVAVVLDGAGGALCDAQGSPETAWHWTRSGRAERPFTFKVSDFLTLRVSARHAVTLLFHCQHECVRLSVSPVSTAPADSPRAEIDLLRGQAEVKRLRQRIRSTLVAWMEHYRRAVGLGAGLPARPREPTNRLPAPPAPPPPPPLPAPARAGPAPGSAAAANRAGDRGERAEAAAVAVADQSRQDRGRRGRDDASPARPLAGFQSDPGAIAGTGSVGVAGRGAGAGGGGGGGGGGAAVELACPVSLRAALGGRAPARPSAGQRCQCSSRRVPCVTDAELDALLWAAPRGGPQRPLQVVVVVVVDSAAGQPPPSTLQMVESVYEEKNRHRTAPCVQSRGDSFRLLQYDVSPAARLPGRGAPLLVTRNGVWPGIFLMYAAGRLLFADHLLDGYGVTRRDLRRQIARSRGDFLSGRFLPHDFRLWSDAFVSSGR